MDEFSDIAKSYYTTQKLKKLNEEAEELKPQVDKLDPSMNNLSEEINQIDSLEMDVKNHHKKSNYINQKAGDLKMASSDLLKNAQEDRLTYRKVLDKVRSTIKEVSVLAENLDVDEKNTLVDESVNEAEEYLDKIKAFDPDVMFKLPPKSEQCKVDDIIAQVDDFVEPINEQKKKLDDFKEELEDFDKRIEDLRQKARDSQMNALAAEKFNKKNGESRLIQNLEAISNSVKEADNALKEAKTMQNTGKKLLTDLDLTFQDAERLNKELENISNDIEEIIPKNEDEYKTISPIMQKVFDHVLDLQLRKDGLADQYSNITENSNDAIKAVGAYGEIEHHIDVARNLSSKGKEDADEAWELVQGLGDRAGKSLQSSADSNHEGRDSLSAVQHDLKPNLEKAKNELDKLKMDIEKLDKEINNINNTFDTIKSDPQTETWNKIIKQANDALEMKKEANDTLEPIYMKLDSASDLTAKLSKDVEDTNKDIIQASNQVQRVGDLVPNIIGMITELEEKQGKQSMTNSQIGEDIERLRKQINRARSLANSIKVGVQFMPNTTLELKPPENLQAQSFNTRVSTYFRTDKPNGFLMYLGNEPKPGARTKRDDFMAIEIENGYPVLLIDVGDGPERIINGKLVDDNKWYEAIVERKGQDVTFTIREEDDQGVDKLHEKKETLPGDKTNFRFDDNSRLFVGGYSDYQMPDSIKQSSFEGEIEGLKIGDAEVGLWNFVDGQNNHLGALERDRLVAKEAKYTGYRFGGNGYVVIDAKQFNFKQRAHITFNFKAGRDSANGLLFYVGHENHFISLELRDGNVVFQFKLGQASQVVEIKSAQSFNDDQWHRVSATRDSGEGQLAVDDNVLYENTIFQPENYQAPDKMYFGGYPDQMFLPGVQTRSFDGCIDEVQVDSNPIDLSRNIDAIDVSPGCPTKFSPVVGFVQDKYGYIKIRNLTIPNKLNINLKFKTIQSSGVIFYGMNNDQSATISLALEDGILVFRSSKFELNSEDKTFDDGKWHVVTVMHDMRHLRISVDDIHEFVSEQAPPSLFLTFGEIYFGGLPRGFSPIGGALPNDAYFVGCIQDVSINSNVVNFASSTDKQNAVLNSCPRDIVLYDAQESLVYYPSGAQEKAKKKQENIDARVNVDENEIPDERIPSKPSGSDSESGVTQSTTKAPEIITTTTSPSAIVPAVVTQPPVTESTTTKKPYSVDEKHPECVLPAIPNYEVDFDAGYRFGTKPESFIEFLPIPESTKQAYEFSLTFRTDKESGLLFYASDERHTDFVAIYLKDGYVNHLFSCANNPVTLISEKQFNNNEWHTIIATRDKTKFALKDVKRGDETKTDHKAKCRNMDLSRNYLVGGSNEKVLEDIEMNLKFEKGHLTKNAFFGCIKDVKLNSVPLILNDSPSDAVLPCSDQIEKGVFFGKSGGYLKLSEKFKVGTDLTISMDIKPRNLTGVLTSVHGKKSFFIVEMIKGSIFLSVDSGDGPRTVSFQPDPDKSLCDGNWHTVTVIKSRFILSINVGKF
jgi:laminin, alpha 3/5